MKKAFTIIEVMIAVMILALVGTALLKNAGAGLDFMQKISKKEQVIDSISVVVAHRNPDFNHLKKSLYDFVEQEFLIDDIELLKILKGKKFLYQESEAKISLPTLEGFSQQFVEEEEKNQANLLNFTFTKISIQGNGGDHLFVVDAM
ncbi:type II secretion system protein [Nitratiruptor tergarcus]|uniref:Prepilin-type N-terminal cleavage/methylation domain-containing protein n=1 Tax=Nitratiruptor tergarcus DSM 16512 TaxID=1069081 RepID=A0A1W1WV44_9BACT|nr:type II secretion system protein [Nitratiruptor tergarcus]SMC10194.1 prepilin-type N-terminal cleavage/methylation domain-containing protein [Nitratiruptor tergarcus DSM 16512]